MFRSVLFFSRISSSKLTDFVKLRKNDQRTILHYIVEYISQAEVLRFSDNP